MPTSNQSSPVLLQTVLSASQNAVMVYQAQPSSDGSAAALRLTMVNAAAERNLGRPAIELLGLTFDRLYPHLVGTGLDDRYRQVIETGVSNRFEFSYSRPGLSTPAWCDVSAVPLGENSVVVSYYDISQHKADADAARLAHVLQQTFDASANGITVLEAMRDGLGQIIDFQFVMINQAGLQMSGYQREQLLGRTLWEIYPATGINGLFAEYVRVYETEQPITKEHYYPEYDCWREVKIVRVPKGVMLTYSDITAIKKTAVAAQKQNDLLDDIVDHVPMGIAVLNVVRYPQKDVERIVDFRLVRINELLEKIIGQKNKDIRGQLLTSVIDDAEASGLLSRLIVAAKEGKTQAFELPFVINKKVSWFKLSVSPKGDQLLLALTDITQTKQAQLDYYQQAELLNSVLNGSQNAIVAFDAIRDASGVLVDFRYVLQNKVNQELINRADDQLLGHTLLEFFPEVRHNGHLTAYAQVVSTGMPFRMELEFDYGKGTGWYDLSAVKRGDGFVLTVQNKTNQKRAEQRIQEQTQLLESISNNTPAGLVLWEAVREDTPQRKVLDFRYRMSNLMNSYITGHPVDALIGQDLLQRFPRFRGTGLEFALRETLETGRSQRMIFSDYTETAGGWFDAQFVIVGDGRSTDRVLMTYMDVTEAHQAQLDQKTQADLLQQVIDAQPSGIVLFEPVYEEPLTEQPGQIVDFTYKLVNETQRKLTGRSTGELIGQRLRTLFPSDQGFDLFERIREVAQTGHSKEWLMPFYSDNIQGWFQVSLIKHGQDVLFTFLDVTGLKQQQQTLEYVNHELRRSNENLQKFAYVASHDLQEPLRKIQSFGSILSSNYAPVLDAYGQDIIQRMQGAANRMSTLIKHLLDYSRLTTQQFQLKPVKLSDLLAHALDELSILVEESGARVEWGELPEIQGDELQLHQLFQNLLSNALKFRLPGVAPRIQVSSRRITTEQLPPALRTPILGMASTKTGNSPLFYEINVADNGIGFDEKYLDRIFQVFQRLHGKDIYAGTGIGLAICQKVVETHQGALTATSRPGAGATFSVYLPILQLP